MVTLQTGWGVVEAELIKTPKRCTIQQKENWRRRSPNLDSVPRCEARAILKALQVAEVGEMIHAHTDSKTTVQQIRVMMEEGRYRKKRKYKNKKIITSILEAAETKELGR